MSLLKDGKQSAGIFGLISFLQMPDSRASFDRSLRQGKGGEVRSVSF
jgi:hypothetical protein